MARASYVVLEGSFRAPVPGAEVVHLPLEDIIEITLRLKSANSRGFPRVDSIGSHLPRNRTYLARDQYKDAFGPSIDARRVVEDFLSSSGLTLLAYEAGGRSVRASGTHPAVQNAFQTSLAAYRYVEGGVERVYRGRSGYVQLPTYLAEFVEGVFGLDDRPQAVPFVKSKGSAHACDLRPLTLPVDFYEGIISYYKFPYEFYARQQCIGIIEFGGGFLQRDVSTFFAACRVPNRTIKVISAGAANKTNKGNSADLEVALDIDLSGVFAPDAKIAVYFAPPTEKGWVDALGAAVHDSTNKPSTLNISWGFPEGPDHWTDDCVQAINSLLQDAGAFGITVCVASGDGGPELQANLAHVNFPASSPYVLSCGGTMFGPNWPPTSECVWLAPGLASGGGISDALPIPEWQRFARPPSVVLPRAVPNFKGRMLPDVAALANNLLVVFDESRWTSASGTSAASPLWAALIARINEGLTHYGISSTLGYFNPLLYESLQKLGVCNDIISGTNSVNAGAGYLAGYGWDACTGWGSPNGKRLLQALMG